MGDHLVALDLPIIPASSASNNCPRGKYFGNRLQIMHEFHEPDTKNIRLRSLCRLEVLERGILNMKNRSPSGLDE